MHLPLAQTGSILSVDSGRLSVRLGAGDQARRALWVQLGADGPTRKLDLPSSQFTDMHLVLSQ